jgi:hypothetical protein
MATAVIYELNPTFDQHSAIMEFFRLRLLRQMAVWLDPGEGPLQLLELSRRYWPALDQVPTDRPETESLRTAVTQIRNRILFGLVVGGLTTAFWIAQRPSILPQPTIPTISMVAAGLSLFLLYQAGQLPRGRRRTSSASKMFSRGIRRK